MIVQRNSLLKRHTLSTLSFPKGEKGAQGPTGPKGIGIRVCLSYFLVFS